MTSSRGSKTEDVQTATFGKCLVLICSLYTQGIAMGCPFSLSVMFLDWQDTFQVTSAQTAVVLSTCIGILFGGAIFPGYVMKNYGPRITLLSGSFLASMGLFLSMFAVNINFLIGTTGVIGGVGFCFLQLPVIPCLTLVFTRHRTLAISLCMTGVGLVSVVLPILLRHLVKLYSWRGAMAFAAGITLNTSVTSMVITSLTTPQNRSEMLGVNDNNDENNDDDNNDNVHYDSECDDTKIAKLCASSSEIITKTSKDISGTDCPETNHLSTKAGTDQSSSVEEEVGSLSIISSYQNHHDTQLRPQKPMNRLRISDNKFLADFLYHLVLLQVGVSVASIYSFSTMMMDFSRTSGFDRSTGLLFIVSAFTCSIFGRVIIGLVDIVKQIHSVVVFVIFSITGSLSLALLSFISHREFVMVILCILGVSFGGQATIYPKCVLDMRSVTTKTYPVAYGFACSLEGIVDIIVPVVIGAAVDSTESYSLILMVLACASSVSTIMLAFGYIHSKRTSREAETDHNTKEETTMLSA